MPHNIFLHSALVRSRKVDHRDKAATKEAIFYNSVESSIALFCSFIVNMFVVCVFAASFYPNTNIK